MPLFHIKLLKAAPLNISIPDSNFTLSSRAVCSPAITRRPSPRPDAPDAGIRDATSLPSCLPPLAGSGILATRQPPGPLEGVAQDPLDLAVCAAHLVVRPTLDRLPYDRVYAERILLACHGVPSYRDGPRVVGHLPAYQIRRAGGVDWSTGTESLRSAPQDLDLGTVPTSRWASRGSRR